MRCSSPARVDRAPGLDRARDRRRTRCRAAVASRDTSAERACIANTVPRGSRCTRTSPPRTSTTQGNAAERPLRRTLAGSRTRPPRRTLLAPRATCTVACLRCSRARRRTRECCTPGVPARRTRRAGLPHRMERPRAESSPHTAGTRHLRRAAPAASRRSRNRIHRPPRRPRSSHRPRRPAARPLRAPRRTRRAPPPRAARGASRHCSSATRSVPCRVLVLTLAAVGSYSPGSLRPTRIRPNNDTSSPCTKAFESCRIRMGTTRLAPSLRCTAFRGEVVVLDSSREHRGTPSASRCIGRCRRRSCNSFPSRMHPRPREPGTWRGIPPAARWGSGR